VLDGVYGRQTTLTITPETIIVSLVKAYDEAMCVPAASVPTQTQGPVFLVQRDRDWSTKNEACIGSVLDDLATCHQSPASSIALSFAQAATAQLRSA